MVHGVEGGGLGLKIFWLRKEMRLFVVKLVLRVYRI